jgi:hypothetical protein
MAAGLGFKNFTSGEVLTAADVNGYLMQGVGVFADATERDAEITSPQEGQFAYLKDTNVTTYYTGSAWVGLGASPLTTKGDVYTYSTTDARLAVGANDTVLTADSSTATGVKWAAVAGGGMTQLATGSLSGTSTSITSIPSGYRDLQLVIGNMVSTAGNFDFTFNSDTSANYGFNILKGGTTQYAAQSNFFPDQSTSTNASFPTSIILKIFEYTSTSNYLKNFAFYGGRSNATNQFTSAFGVWSNSSALTSIQIRNSSSFTSGTYTLYGVK